MLLTGDFAYLADFGVARAIDGTRDSALTATGATVGTLGYMAPERFLGDRVDHRADVYALACVLVELLTGRPPFAGVSGPALMHAHTAAETRLVDAAVQHTGRPADPWSPAPSGYASGPRSSGPPAYGPTTYGAPAYGAQPRGATAYAPPPAAVPPAVGSRGRRPRSGRGGYDIVRGTAVPDDGAAVFVIGWGEPSSLLQGFVAGEDPAAVWNWWLVNTPF